MFFFFLYSSFVLFAVATFASFQRSIGMCDLFVSGPILVWFPYPEMCEMAVMAIQQMDGIRRQTDGYIGQCRCSWVWFGVILSSFWLESHTHLISQCKPIRKQNWIWVYSLLVWLVLVWRRARWNWRCRACDCYLDGWLFMAAICCGCVLCSDDYESTESMRFRSDGKWMWMWMALELAGMMEKREMCSPQSMFQYYWVAKGWQGRGNG